MKWETLSDMEQVYLYWEYCAANDNDDIPFTEFERMMKEEASM